MTDYDTLLVEGTDLSTLVCLEFPYEWPYIAPDQRGEFPTYPGIDGAANVDQPYGPLVLPVPMSLAPDDFCEDGATEEEQFANANLRYRTLRRLCRPGQLITLKRRMSYPGGNEEHTARARMTSSTPSRQALQVMRAVVEFTLLELWYGPAVAIAVAAGTHTIDGDTRTHRMTITFAAGAARTLTNTTNGYWVSYDATVPTGGVIIDVEARTARALTGGADLSSHLHWAKTHPMRLDEGSNTLTLSAGAASISYQPAYL